MQSSYSDQLYYGYLEWFYLDHVNISVNILLAIDSINRTTVSSSPTSGDVQVSTGVRNLILRSSDYVIVNLK